MLNDIMYKLYSLLKEGINPTILYISYQDFISLEKELETPIDNFLDLKIIIKEQDVDVK